MEVFPAVLPASLVNLDPSVPECPVLGWAHCGNGRCLPLVLGRPGGLGDSLLDFRRFVRFDDDFGLP